MSFPEPPEILEIPEVHISHCMNVAHTTDYTVLFDEYKNYCNYLYKFVTFKALLKVSFIRSV